MRTPREATERTIKLAKQHIAQQESRIEQQQQLLASLESEGHTDMANAARQLLDEMMILLARMHDDLNQAEARLKAQGAERSQP